MKRAFLFFLCLSYSFAWGQAPLPVAIDSQSVYAPNVEVYQSSPRTLRVTFTDGGSASMITNKTPFFAWFTSNTADSVVTANWSVISPSGVVDFALSASDVNYDAGRYIYQTGLEDTNGPTIVRQGYFVIRSSPYANGADPITFTTNHNWNLISWTGLPDYITDAPSNGTQYARQNGEWAEVVGGGGSITQTGQVNSINGALQGDVTGIATGTPIYEVGGNVSTWTNDAGYVSSNSPVSSFANDSGYVSTGSADAAYVNASGDTMSGGLFIRSTAVPVLTVQNATSLVGVAIGSGVTDPVFYMTSHTNSTDIRIAMNANANGSGILIGRNLSSTNALSDYFLRVFGRAQIYTGEFQKIEIVDPSTNQYISLTATGGLQVGQNSFKALPSGDISQDSTNSATLGITTVQTLNGIDPANIATGTPLYEASGGGDVYASSNNAFTGANSFDTITVGGVSTNQDAITINYNTNSSGNSFKIAFIGSSGATNELWNYNNTQLSWRPSGVNEDFPLLYSTNILSYFTTSQRLKAWGPTWENLDFVDDQLDTFSDTSFNNESLSHNAVMKWDTNTSTWVEGTDNTGSGSGGIVNTVNVQATATTWDATTGTLGLNTNDAAAGGGSGGDPFLSGSVTNGNYNFPIPTNSLLQYSALTNDVGEYVGINSTSSPTLYLASGARTYRPALTVRKQFSQGSTAIGSWILHTHNLDLNTPANSYSIINLSGSLQNGIRPSLLLSPSMVQADSYYLASEVTNAVNDDHIGLVLADDVSNEMIFGIPVWANPSGTAAANPSAFPFYFQGTDTAGSIRLNGDTPANAQDYDVWIQNSSGGRVFFVDAGASAVSVKGNLAVTGNVTVVEGNEFILGTNAYLLSVGTNVLQIQRNPPVTNLWF